MSASGLLQSSFYVVNIKDNHYQQRRKLILKLQILRSFLLHARNKVVGSECNNINRIWSQQFCGVLAVINDSGVMPSK